MKYFWSLNIIQRKFLIIIVLFSPLSLSPSLYPFTNPRNRYSSGPQLVGSEERASKGIKSIYSGHVPEEYHVSARSWSRLCAKRSGSEWRLAIPRGPATRSRWSTRGKFSIRSTTSWPAASSWPPAGMARAWQHLLAATRSDASSITDFTLHGLEALLSPSLALQK